MSLYYEYKCFSNQWLNEYIISNIKPDNYKIARQVRKSAEPNKIQYLQSSGSTERSKYSDISNDDIQQSRHKFIKLIDPVSSDDKSQGYQIGDIWFVSETDKTFVCVNNTIGNAVWNEIKTDDIVRTEWTSSGLNAVTNRSKFSNFSWDTTEYKKISEIETKTNFFRLTTISEEDENKQGIQLFQNKLAIGKPVDTESKYDIDVDEILIENENFINTRVCRISCASSQDTAEIKFGNDQSIQCSPMDGFILTNNELLVNGDPYYITGHSTFFKYDSPVKGLLLPPEVKKIHILAIGAGGGGGQGGSTVDFDSSGGQYSVGGGGGASGGYGALVEQTIYLNSGDIKSIRVEIGNGGSSGLPGSDTKVYGLDQDGNETLLVTAEGGVGGANGNSFFAPIFGVPVSGELGGLAENETNIAGENSPDKFDTGSDPSPGGLGGQALIFPYNSSCPYIENLFYGIGGNGGNGATANDFPGQMMQQGDFGSSGNPGFVHITW